MSGVFRGPSATLVPTIHGFARTAKFSHALSKSLRLYPVYVHNLRNCSLVLFGNDAFRK